MSATASVNDDSMPALDPLIGIEVSGRYAVHRLVARGGMGAVYQGVHVELGRPVAIKVLCAGYARDEEAVRRFQREARTASRIDHPSIVAILDLGRLETGEPYLVMELLEGEDLADFIAANGPLRPARIVELLTPIASALDAVHREGLLHRDIKPANIFLAARGDGSVAPKLLDFGLAALREAPDTERLTRDGIVVGTPHYVSPEAAEGEPVDERTDVYSLGLVTFEMLTGVLPIDGDRPMSLMYAKVRRPAPTLSQRTGKNFPTPLEQLIARTLSRTPDRRPASAGAFLAELASIVEALGPDTTSIDLPRVGAQDDGTPERERPMRASEPLELPTERRTRWIVLAMLAASLVAATMGAWLAWSEEPAPVVRDVPRPIAPGLAADEPADVAPSPTQVSASVASAEPAPREPAPARRPPSARRARDEIAPPPIELAPVAPPSVAPPSVAPPSVAQSPAAPSVERDPLRAAELTREAGVALLRGEVPRARQLYRQATFTDAAHAPAWRGLGLASERMGMTPEAVTAYRRYLQIAPSASDAPRVRARLAQLDGPEAP